MTNTTMFTCTVTSKTTWETKKFFSMIPGKAHDLAVAWLATH
jgi:hypothetical protein